MALDRRRFLHLAGAGGLTLAAGPVLWRQAAVAGAPGPAQLHVQFGADAAREAVISWATPVSVAHPRVRLGTPRNGYGATVAAQTRTYTDHATGREVLTHHAPLAKLAPDTDYVYEALADGSPASGGSFRTGPDGRAAFRFTSFGDQGVSDPHYTEGSPFSASSTAEVEAARPLLHLVNGDLAYSDLQSDPAGAWDAWFTMNEPSARRRAWMPAAGNHENETGNGTAGYAAFRTRFAVPDNGLGDLSGYFYAFTVGAVRFVVLQNDDVCLQNGGNFYVRGYSGGAQRQWLETALAEARADRAIDWVVVCMHQLVISSAVAGNGGDLGIREAFAPLFDRYGVDLVLCGHDHDYERSYPVRGVLPGSPVLTPAIADRTRTLVDTTRGSVHLTLGGGGAVPLNVYGGHGPAAEAKVIVGKGQSFAGQVEFEPAQWSAVIDPGQAYGFAVFDVDPGPPGGRTQIHVTYNRTNLVPGQPPEVYDRFVLERPRSDAAQ
ncbi:MAG: purple acid phosphatase family protein [Mycobacteriales bacterium]